MIPAPPSPHVHSVVEGNGKGKLPPICPLCGPGAFVEDAKRHVDSTHGLLTQGEASNLLMFLALGGVL